MKPKALNKITKADKLKQFDLPDDAAAYAETAPAMAAAKAGPAAAITHWRAAEAVKALLKAVNKAFPNRKKDSDGTMGDGNHCPGTSDHCPQIIDGGVGVVTAVDITHDPAHGCDMGAVTAKIVAARDPRIKYIIHHGRICSSYPHNGAEAWTWRAYSGSNPHNHHAHFSVKADKASYDNASAWTVT